MSPEAKLTIAKDGTEICSAVLPPRGRHAKLRGTLLTMAELGKIAVGAEKGYPRGARWELPGIYRDDLDKAFVPAQDRKELLGLPIVWK